MAQNSASRSSASSRPAFSEVADFVTIWAADALRASEYLRFRIEALKAAEGRPEPAARFLRRAIEVHLDRGLGSCPFREAEFARLIEDGILRTHDRRARLLAWTVMPNHVHVLCERKEGVGLRSLVSGWKTTGVRRLNARCGRTGVLWARDVLHRPLSDPADYRRAVAYVEANPLMAGLVRDHAEHRCSSRRFRTVHELLDAAELSAAAEAARATPSATTRRGSRAGTTALRAEPPILD